MPGDRDNSEKIVFNEAVWGKLEDVAATYMMSPYYFVKMLAVRFVSQRESIPVNELMQDEKAALVATNEYLSSPEARRTVVANGLTTAFWSHMADYAFKYGMEVDDYYRYVVLRYLEDCDNDCINDDLWKCFGLPSNHDDDEDEIISLEGLF